MWDEDEAEPLADEPRVRDLVKAGTLPTRGVLGEPMWNRLAQPRLAWRPVGCSKRLWMRVAGEDPFVGPERAVITRRTVYADGRFVRIDRAAAETAPRKVERGDGNKGESLIPEGFRSLPAAKSGPPPAPKPAAKPRPAAPPTPPPPERVYSPSGRMRGTVRRTPAGLGSSPPTPLTEGASAPTPSAPPAPVAPPPAALPPVVAPPADDAPTTPRPPSGETPDDVMAAPKEGRARLKPRR